MVGQEFVDIHSHILPGIDDGPVTIAESVQMANIAYKQGICTIVCTPHAQRDYDKLIGVATEKKQLLQDKLINYGIPVTLHLGFEVLVCEPLMQYGDLNRLSFQMGGRPYVLLEFGHAKFPGFLDEILYLLKTENIRPILAHPERYAYLQDNITFIRNLKDRGVLMQINAGSVTGEYGQAVQLFVRKIIKSGLADYLATDMHSSSKKGPRIRQAQKMIQSWASPLTAVSLFDHMIETGL